MEISQEQFDNLGAIIDAKHRFAYRMAEVLRSVQWHHGRCVECGRPGHEPDCELGNVLREWDESGQTGSLVT